MDFEKINTSELQLQKPLGKLAMVGSIVAVVTVSMLSHNTIKQISTAQKAEQQVDGALGAVEEYSQLVAPLTKECQDMIMLGGEELQKEEQQAIKGGEKPRPDNIAIMATHVQQSPSCAAEKLPRSFTLKSLTASKLLKEKYQMVQNTQATLK